MLGGTAAGVALPAPLASPRCSNDRSGQAAQGSSFSSLAASSENWVLEAFKGLPGTGRRSSERKYLVRKIEGRTITLFESSIPTGA